MAKARVNEDRLQQIEQPRVDTNNSPFVIRTANETIEYAMSLPPLQKLMGEFIYENCLTMLYSETGYGKTCFAVQMANAISRGESMLGLENDCEPQRVLYVDIENGESIFKSRYSENRTVHDTDGKKKVVYFNPFTFHSNFTFAFLTDADKYKVDVKNPVQFWLDFIDYHAEQYKAKVIFIDNLLAIGTMGGGIETTKEVAPLIQGLMSLKKSRGYTIILLHHTPKRNRKDPLTRNDLAGSSNLSNLVDSCIGINKSYYDKKESSRYLKQVKAPRQGRIVYGEGNVIPCKIDLIQPNFVGFQRIELGEDEGEWKYESTHIKPYVVGTKGISYDEVKEREHKTAEILKANPKITTKALGDELGVTRQTANTYRKKYNKQLEAFNNYGQ